MLTHLHPSIHVLCLSSFVLILRVSLYFRKRRVFYITNIKQDLCNSIVILGDGHLRHSVLLYFSKT